MQLSNFFTPETIALDLRGGTKDEILAELVGLFQLDERASETLLRMLQRRETLGSTGVGRGIAIPHCRSLVVSRLRLAYGHHTAGVEFQAIGTPPGVRLLLIVAPPLEVSNQYLPVLGKIAQFAKDADIPERLAALRSVDEFMQLLGARGCSRCIRGFRRCCSSSRPSPRLPAKPRRTASRSTASTIHSLSSPTPAPSAPPGTRSPASARQAPSPPSGRGW